MAIEVEWRESTEAAWQKFECDDAFDDGESYVGWIIREQLSFDPANWENFDGTIEIRLPEEYAGSYAVSIETEPRVDVHKLS